MTIVSFNHVIKSIHFVFDVQNNRFPYFTTEDQEGLLIYGTLECLLIFLLSLSQPRSH